MSASRQTITLPSGGAPVHYFRAGRGEPLLYLHHLAGMQGWEPALDQLAARYDVIAPYHPGWGPSEGLDDIETGLDIVLHYCDLLDALGIESAHIVGHSIGAWMGAEFAAIMPHRVKKLVLATPVGIWDDALQGEDPFAQNPMKATEVLLANPARREHLILKDGAVDQTDQYVQEMKDLRAAAKFLWPLPDTGVARRLNRIAAPTLLLTADADRFVPKSYGPIWQRHIHGSRLDSIADAGHLVNLEQPAALANMAGAFCAN
jgi:pimeloyl-ACP methyl ester carboxylesterase